MCYLLITKAFEIFFCLNASHYLYIKNKIIKKQFLIKSMQQDLQNQNDENLRLQSKQRLKDMIEKLTKALDVLEDVDFDSLVKNTDPSKSVKKQQEAQIQESNMQPLTDFEQGMKKFLSIGQNQTPEISAMTKIVWKVSQMMTVIYYNCERVKSLNQDDLKKAQSFFLKQFDQLKAYEKNFDLKPFYVICKDFLQANYWVFSNDFPYKHIMGMVESAEFYSLEIRKMEKNELVEWWDSANKAYRGLHNLIKINYPGGIEWNPKGDQQSLNNMMSQLQSIQDGEEIKQSTKKISDQPQNSDQQTKSQIKEQTNQSNMQPLTDFEQGMKKFLSIGQNQTPEISAMTKIVWKVSQMMTVIYYNCERVKSLNQDDLKKAQSFFLKQFDQLKAYEKNFDLKPFYVICKDFLQANYWVFSNDFPYKHIMGMVESAEFYSLEIRKMEKNELVEWWDSANKAYRGLHNLIKINYPGGIEWNPKGDQQSLNNMMSQLQSIQDGEEIQKSSQNANEQINKVQQLPQKQPEQQVQKPAQVKKQPKMYNNNGWYIENYTNENIQLSADQVKMKDPIFVINCVNTNIKIQGKCKFILVEKCQKSKIIFDSVVSTFEIMNSQKVQIYPLKQQIFYLDAFQSLLISVSLSNFFYIKIVEIVKYYLLVLMNLS